MTLPAGYSLRPAAARDAPVLAELRALFLVDFGVEIEEGSEALWMTYFQAALTDGRYWAALAEADGQVVACAGLMVHDMVPVPSDPSGQRAHVQGVYIRPEHRGRGLAEALTRAALREAQARGLRAANLNASDMGRTIYERLGFTLARSPEMRLNLVEAHL